MFETAPNAERWKLGFEEAVLSSFSFVGSYGFAPVVREPTFVRFETDDVFLNVYHGRGSYEIGVEVGRRDRTEKYSLNRLVHSAGDEAWAKEGLDRATQFQASSREAVQTIVPRVARVVEQYGGRFLSGDVEFYDAQEQQSEAGRVQFERNSLLNSVKRGADKAWQSRDFRRVVEFLKPIEDDLTKIEAKRLAYSVKQTREPGNPRPEAPWSDR